MPELPEVETVKKQLETCIMHKPIIQVIAYSPKLRYPITIPQKQEIITKIYRRSKYIICELNSNKYLILHLGMTGFFQYIKYDSEYAKLDKLKHTHVDIYFEDGVLRYIDPRRFGAMIYTDNLNHTALNKLGPEPLDMSIDELGQHLFNSSKKRKQPIKLFITNNEIIVVIGNIYACEVLFESHINPQTVCSEISLEHYKIMAQHIQSILHNAIKYGGSTIDNFTHLHIYEKHENANIINQDEENMLQNKGYFQIQHKVYGKQNNECTKCKNLITKIVQGQRSTYFCQNCQVI